MNYSVLIENRKSTRAFAEKGVAESILQELKSFHDKSVHRLMTERRTELLLFGTEAREALEGAAGYKNFLVGAPHYMMLLGEGGKFSAVDSGFIMEDLILKAADLGLGSCWITFTDSDKVKAALKIESPLEVAAIAAIGYEVKAARRLRLNILSMSNVDVVAERQYMEPKKRIKDLVFLDKWGNTEGMEEYIGFFDDMLWEALHAASLSPSYLNRQAYGFVIHNNHITLISRPDDYNTKLDGCLSMGAALLHYSAVAEKWMGNVAWTLGEGNGIGLPEGYKAMATSSL